MFGEDVQIPGTVLARYWTTTSGGEWSAFATRRFCQRLAELGLVSDYHSGLDWVVVHDVIRAYPRDQTRHQHSELNHALIEAHRDLVPEHDGMSAWWQLPTEHTYLWSWLPTHLHHAGLGHELRTCLHHPRWLVRKLEQTGPAGLETDLALSPDPLSRALSTAIRQNAHVLAPLDPPGSLAATLASRLPGNEPTTTITHKLLAELSTPHLRALTPYPTSPAPPSPESSPATPAG